MLSNRSISLFMSACPVNSNTLFPYCVNQTEFRLDDTDNNCYYFNSCKF